MKYELRALIEKLSPASRLALERAAETCVRYTHYNVELEHLILALLDLPETDFQIILRRGGVDVETLRTEATSAIEAFKTGNPRTPALAPTVPQLLESAWSIASLRYGAAEIRTAFLLLAALEHQAIRALLSESVPALLGVARPEALSDDLPQVLADSPEAPSPGRESKAPDVPSHPSPDTSSNQVMISYAREDSAFAERLCERLSQEGWRVFWDRRIPIGQTWEKVLERTLAEVGAVVVVWSEHSVHSEWVDIEAAEAMEKKVLVPVRIDETAPPLRYGRIQTANLAAWKGEDSDELRRVIEAIRLLVTPGEEPTVAPSPETHESPEPSATGGAEDKKKLRTVLGLRRALAERVIGQEDALETICRRINTAAAGLGDDTKPTGVFLLFGPDGVGKTETATALADAWYGGELVSISLSEYREAHSISTLRGVLAADGGAGKKGLSTEAVRQSPRSVVLLDEMEKAHPDIVGFLTKAFTRGWAEDGEGRVDFRHTIVLLTTNVGAAEVVEAHRASGDHASSRDLVGATLPVLQEAFGSAFLRGVVTVPYRPLSPSDLEEIAVRKLAEVQRRIWERHQADLLYDEEVVSVLVSRCTEDEAGARGVDDLISDTLLPELALAVLSHQSDGQTFDMCRMSVGADGAFAFVLSQSGRDEPAS